MDLIPLRFSAWAPFVSSCCAWSGKDTGVCDCSRAEQTYPGLAGALEGSGLEPPDGPSGCLASVGVVTSPLFLCCREGFVWVLGWHHCCSRAAVCVFWFKVSLPGSWSDLTGLRSKHALLPGAQASGISARGQEGRGACCYKQAERRLWFGSTQRIRGCHFLRLRTVLGPHSHQRQCARGKVQCLELVFPTGKRWRWRRKSQSQPRGLWSLLQGARHRLLIFPPLSSDTHTWPLSTRHCAGFWASGDDCPLGAHGPGFRPAVPHVLSWKPRAWEPSRGEGLSHRGIIGVLVDRRMHSFSLG